MQQSRCLQQLTAGEHGETDYRDQMPTPSSLSETVVPGSIVQPDGNDITSFLLESMGH